MTRRSRCGSRTRSTSPKTTEGDKLDAAKKFVAFANSADGCEVQNDTGSAAGPYVTSACTLPDDVPALIADIQKYFDDGKTGSALEFLSPIKGPNLENITVAVGSGITGREDGAAQYDDDVKKQAQQLGTLGLVNPAGSAEIRHTRGSAAHRRRPRFTKE